MVSRKDSTFLPLNLGACFDSGKGRGIVTERPPVVTLVDPLMFARARRRDLRLERGRSGEVLGDGREDERRVGGLGIRELPVTDRG